MSYCGSLLDWELSLLGQLDAELLLVRVVDGGPKLREGLPLKLHVEHVRKVNVNALNVTL